MLRLVRLPPGHRITATNQPVRTVSETSHIAIFSSPGKLSAFWPQKRTQAVACFRASFSEDGGTTMLAITILVAATGLALGLRFNVFVLVPVLLLAITSIFVIGIWSGGNARVIALHLLATLASVQISYLIGCLIAAQFPTRDKTTSSRIQTRYLRRFSTGAAMR
jgi:hypothetical protein